jgi:hypothetical protein
VKRRLGDWCEMAASLRVSLLEQLVGRGVLASGQGRERGK